MPSKLTTATERTRETRWAKSTPAMRPTPLTLALCGFLSIVTPSLAQPWASESQRSAGRQALAALGANRQPEAEALAQAADPLLRKYLAWTRLQRSGQGSAQEIVAWLQENPDWPLPETLARRGEEALAASSDDDLALAFFSRNPARTLPGALRQATALNNRGRAQEAAAVLRRGWLDLPADAAAEAQFASLVAPLLSPVEQWQRFDRLSLARDTAGAGRQLVFLQATDRARAELRLAYANDRADAPADLQPAANDLGLMVERARWLRRRDRDQEAAQLWERAAPLQVELAAAAQRTIWSERQVLSRKLLRLGDSRLAYSVAAQHGQAYPSEGWQEAEFLAGFIALRRLNDPSRAAAHFARLGEGSRSVLTRARSAYWQAAAAHALGDNAMAQAKYREAADFPVAFYGQLAALALGEGPSELAARIGRQDMAPPDAEAASLFVLREMTKVVIMLADLGEARRARVFLLRMEDLAAGPADRVLIARLAQYIGRPDHGVWVARRAWADGVVLLREGWPSPYETPADILEPALTNAIARQESNFDTEAVSSANARGLMQLLPATAAQVARRLNIASSTPRLTSDPALNLRLGSAYLAEILDRFSGNLALAAAAYNAGPRRVQEWLGTYGDPTIGALPLIDWIEQIPFGETRNYVQRVVENAVVYRALEAGSASKEHPLKAWLVTAGP